MSNFTDFFPAAGGGGGGGIPKYQEFTSSGTFTPTQALIDAGGRVSFIIVAGGQRGVGTYLGGAGGAVRLGYATLTSTTGCSVSIGAGGTSNGASGGNTVVSFSSAGGADITSAGGSGGTAKNQTKYSGATNGYNSMSSGMPSTLGYGGSGGAVSGDTFGGENGKRTNIDNYGAGSFSGSNAASGFVRITWFE